MAFRHRLSAVWFADIVDYSTISASDEPLALRLVAAFQNVVSDVVPRYGGRVVKFLGDGALAEFGSTQAAISAAHTVNEMFEVSAMKTGTHGPFLRIGIHSGEVVRSEDGDLYGDGVNVAARICESAGPGEIVVSDDVWRQARQRPEFAFQPLETRDLKGVGAVQLFRVDVVEPVAPETFESKEAPEEPLPSVGKTRIRPATVAATAASILVAAAVLHLVTRDASRPPSVQAELAPSPAVAVMPFQVSGNASEEWQESMVDLLSTNLDGVAGLRAIDSQTILARWSEGVGDESPADIPAVLEVGRAAGARYVVLGHAVGVGRRLRLIADVYDLETGARLGQGRAEGAADSVFTLVDRLTIDVLSYLDAHSGRGQTVSLARVTTDSLLALKAFLEGETRFRRGDFAGAFQAFQRATEIDSTFAFAFFRLGQTSGWGREFGSSLPHYEQAIRHADRLPARERLVLEGALSRERGRLEAIPLLERATRLYPEDVTAWFELGEAYYHLGAQALLDRGVSETAFERALAIDEAVSPAYIHLIEGAFGFHADLARAQRLVTAFEASTDPGAEARLYRTAFDLAFGDADVQRRARAELDALPTMEAWFIAKNLLWHPRHLALQEEVYDRYAQYPQGIVDARLRRGKLGAAMDILADGSIGEAWRARRLYQARAWGLPIRQEALDVLNKPIGPADSLVDAFYRGAYAADRGRWADYERSVRTMETYRENMRRMGNATEVAFASGAVEALSGYRAWREGRLEQAQEKLGKARATFTGFYDDRRDANAVVRRWLVVLARERDDPRETEYLESFWGMSEVFAPIARLELADAYRRAGREEEARATYEAFAVAWAEADSGLRSRLEAMYKYQ